MFKIYAGYTLQVIFDLMVMLSILYGVAWFLLGPDISEIGTEIVKEVLR